MAFRLAAPFEASYHPARAFLLRRGVYLLLAFDAWLVMIEHGGRYGAGDFNVAHFKWIDRLLGVPSPALYVGLLIAAGLSALALALVRARTVERLVLAVLYTASWTISLHDSYQHHYLLSWLLLWSAFIPDPSLAEVLAPSSPIAARSLAEPPVSKTGSATRVTVGIPLTAFTCAIVYAFTALSKSSAEWRSGHVLQRLIQPSSARPDGGPMATLASFMADVFSTSPLQVLAWISWSLIALQLLVALAYACSPGRDTSTRRVRSVLSSAGLVAAVSFHVGAEVARIFEIGWFSYYMLWIAFVLLSPVSWVASFAQTLARLLAPLSRMLSEERPSLARTLMFGLSLLLLYAACGVGLDLPGASVACVLACLGVLAAVTHAYRKQLPGVIEQRTLAGVIACACLWGAITLTSVRFDFYRRWAGEISRLGEVDQALALYRKAEVYAPPGASRARQIKELERRR